MSEQEKQGSEYSMLLDELGILQKELKKDESDPTLIDFAKAAFEDISAHKELGLEYLQQSIGMELRILCTNIIEDLTSKLDNKTEEEKSPIDPALLTPQIVDVLREVRDSAFTYLADKEKDSIASQQVALIEGRSDEFAGESGIFPAVFRRAGAVFSNKV